MIKFLTKKNLSCSFVYRLSIKHFCPKKNQRQFGKERHTNNRKTVLILFLSQWREKQAEIIAQRDAEAEAKKEEKIKHAREEIDKFCEDYNDKKQKAIEENR